MPCDFGKHVIVCHGNLIVTDKKARELVRLFKVAEHGEPEQETSAEREAAELHFETIPTPK